MGDLGAPAISGVSLSRPIASRLEAIDTRVEAIAIRRKDATRGLLALLLGTRSY